VVKIQIIRVVTRCNVAVWYQLFGASTIRVKWC